jgi:hypothetical protein
MVVKPVLAVLAVAALAVPLGAQKAGRTIDIPERLQGADAAVVARVAKVTSTLERNRWGDELIVSHAVLEVEETLKGRSLRYQTLAIEGGSYGGYTMRVSDMPEVAVGERGVFLLKGEAGAAHVPHLRGLGILMLDETGHVRGSSLSLESIRAMSRQVEQ